ncbi:FAD-linked oxidoreductase [Colletotrichum falcatum]|nr:FAD-linked oxidoreductase [Colletotrichum falcatum]
MAGTPHRACFPSVCGAAFFSAPHQGQAAVSAGLPGAALLSLYASFREDNPSSAKRSFSNGQSLVSTPSPPVSSALEYSRTISTLKPRSPPALHPPPSPLAVLPLRMVVRSLLTPTISPPALLSPSLWAMSALAHATSPLLDPDRNPLLRLVGRTIDGVKGIGFTGVILGYAREVVLTAAQTRDLAACGKSENAEECIRNEVIPWARGTMETVRAAQSGEFVALKFTGAGCQALYSLSERLPPSTAMAEAIDSICSLATECGIRLLLDAEQASLQPGIDDWTLGYMHKYNNDSTGEALIHGTYHAYLKSTPHTLQQHLRTAQAEGFTLGVKSVRGAYLGSDPRHLIHDTKADTDACYDGIAESLLKKQWGQGPHCIRATPRHADELSCEVISAGGSGGSPQRPTEARAAEICKYLAWGSTGECMKYLLRRAHENRDAVELVRRAKVAIGVSM